MYFYYGFGILILTNFDYFRFYKKKKQSASKKVIIIFFENFLPKDQIVSFVEFETL